MTISEKLLNAIGLPPMTNKAVLLDAMSEMHGNQLEKLLFGCSSRFENELEEIKCSECKTQHGGSCPRPGEDDRCIISLGDWLEQTAIEATALKIEEALA